MKRRRSVSPDAPGLRGLFELDELFLRVLGYLDAEDLASAQRVSKHWARLAVDPQLWKRLYLREFWIHRSQLTPGRYPHPHHSRLVHTRSGTSTPLRPIARLPSRAFPPPSPSPSPAPSDEGDDADVVRHEGVDWKRMVRLGTNWANGNVLEASLPLPLPPSPVSRPSEPGPGDHHLALFPNFICTASPTSPLVQVYGAGGVGAGTGGTGPAPLGIVPPPPGWSTPSRPDNVTAICADEAVQPPDAVSGGRVLPARLAIFYASGGFAVVKLRFDGRLVWTRESVWDRRTRPPRSGDGGDGDPVVLAAFHHPVLVTCSLSFRVSAYVLAQAVTHVRTLHSDVAFHPAALSLAPHGPAFRATLTYCTPVYPSSWTISVQELGVELSATGGEVRRGECYRVRPSPPSPGGTPWPRRLHPIDGVSRAIGVGTDGRWVVLAGADSVIHVFALPSAKGGIAHAQTLLAPSGGVSALALQSGRCVSGGADGKVLVWELDEDSGADGDEARVGRALGYVEVRPGGRRKLDHAEPQADEASGGDEEEWELPNPRSLAYAARALFLATPPASLPPSRQTEAGANAVAQLAFDEEKIVGLVRTDGDGADVMRVWSFN